MDFKRKIVEELLARTEESVRFLQIVLGPRQVGKTTSVRQLEQQSDLPTIYSAADTAGPANEFWIRSKWQEARALLKSSEDKALLILDEVQLVPEWQQVVKGLWDEDRHNFANIHVVITGSSALLLGKGSESLAGRFEKHELLQWSYSEMNEAFNYSLKDYVLFGGYPGSAPLKDDETRWKNYIRSSLIETVLTKDVIALNRITKPSLLKQLFALACAHPAEVVSYTNFLGQLADAGNVTTLSDYRSLLEEAFLLKTLRKWSGSEVRSRASKPKWIIRDNALITALSNFSVEQIQTSPIYGRLVENTVISHLLKIAPEGFYYREKNYEVDYVVSFKEKLYALEIKSGHRTRKTAGLKYFASKNPDCIPLVLGGGGIPIEEVLLAENSDRYF